MFVDTSVIVAILSREDDAFEWSDRLEAAPTRITSALVLLEATMRMSSKLGIEPAEVEETVEAFLAEASIEVVAIDRRDGKVAVRAFAEFGKGRGHPAQLNLADCLSYACARNRGVGLLYKGRDFAQTDIG